MRAADGLARIDLSDLRGGDELGVLAQGLQDLLQRVNEDVRREQIRAEQEKDMWQAVGHEIMSPLQSLMAWHGAPDDPSHRYINISRMQQAVRADEYSLEDAVTHVLRNADRYRPPGSPIRITLEASDMTQARVVIHNPGPPVPEDMLEKIFEYGVSDQDDAAALGHRGQGLFVARTYMAKMGGTITARNDTGGVAFVLVLQRAGGVGARG